MNTGHVEINFQYQNLIAC